MTRITGLDCAVMCNLLNINTQTGTRTGLGRAEERRRSARNRTGVVDAMWETGETWVERVGSVAANPHNLENRKRVGGGALSVISTLAKTLVSL